MCHFSEVRRRDGGKTEVIGNDTMLGQIATIMENLHMTYREVTETIPYRTLIIMQKDKLSVVYDGEVMKEVSEEEFFKNKNR